MTIKIEPSYTMKNSLPETTWKHKYITHKFVYRREKNKVKKQVFEIVENLLA